MLTLQYKGYNSFVKNTFLSRLFCFCILFFCIFFYADAALHRTLRIGDSGADVLELQKILNTDTRTAVSFSGTGSSGYETNYFGALTQDAVKRFQLLYSSEVLVPAGVTSPTGFVGEFTRKKLSTLSNQAAPVNSAALSTQPTVAAVPALPVSQGASLIPHTIADLVFAMKPKLYGLSMYSGAPGETFMIKGLGFERQNNTVYFSSKAVKNISSDGSVITVTIPEDLPIGSYNVWVENSKGSTFDAKFGNYFTVTKEKVSLPVISSVSPQTMNASNVSQKINVTFTEPIGEGFKLFTSFGEIKNVTIVNNTVTFTLLDVPTYKETKQKASLLNTASIPLYVYGKSQKGFSETPGVVYLSNK